MNSLVINNILISLSILLCKEINIHQIDRLLVLKMAPSMFGKCLELMIEKMSGLDMAKVRKLGILELNMKVNGKTIK